jgi:hypothetical protein
LNWSFVEKKLNRLCVFFDLFKFEHTVFALPFAYLGMAQTSSVAAGGWRCGRWVTVHCRLNNVDNHQKYPVDKQ